MRGELIDTGMESQSLDCTFIAAVLNMPVDFMHIHLCIHYSVEDPMQITDLYGFSLHSIWLKPKDWPDWKSWKLLLNFEGIQDVVREEQKILLQVVMH